MVPNKTVTHYENNKEYKRRIKLEEDFFNNQELYFHGKFSINGKSKKIKLFNSFFKIKEKSTLHIKNLTIESDQDPFKLKESSTIIFENVKLTMDADFIFHRGQLEIYSGSFFELKAPLDLLSCFNIKQRGFYYLSDKEIKNGKNSVFILNNFLQK